MKLNVQRLDVVRRPIELAHYIKRQALETDSETLVNQDCAIYEDGALKIVYLKLNENARPLLRALQRIKFESNSSRRTSGLTGRARTIGFMPRRTLRQDFCHLSKMAEELPDVHKMIIDYATKVSHFYEQVNPDLYLEHSFLTEKVLPEYQLPEAVFTSGIVNKNNAMAYHFDGGNFKDVWSGMIVLKRDVEGGRLVLPEYDLKFDLPHNSLFMFDGQGLLHGVTPIIPVSRKAVRYSIVYYSMRMLWECKPLSEELARIRQVKSEREVKRARQSLKQLNEKTG